MSKKELTGLEYINRDRMKDVKVESNFDIDECVEFEYKEKKKKSCGKCNCKKINKVIIEDDKLIELNDSCFFRLNNINSYMVEDNLVIAIILKEHNNTIRLYYNNVDELKYDLKRLSNYLPTIKKE